MNHTKKTLPLLLFICVLIITACGSAGGQDADVTTLIYANLTKNNVDRAAVNIFNSTHTDVQIEVRDYLDEDGVSGQERLMAEMAAGKISDIIDLGRGYSSLSLLPYQVLARKGYLEDLWPYIENDPDLGREGVLEAPLKAAEVDGGLYALFDEVWINTLTGAESVVGDRMSWTLAGASGCLCRHAGGVHHPAVPLSEAGRLCLYGVHDPGRLRGLGEGTMLLWL